MITEQVNSLISYNLNILPVILIGRGIIVK